MAIAFTRNYAYKAELISSGG